MNDQRRFEIRTVPDKPRHPKKSHTVMLAAFLMFAISWPVIFLIMSMPGNFDLIGLLAYFSGPLPILPTAIFIVGFLMLLCGR